MTPQDTDFEDQLCERFNELHVPRDLFFSDANIMWRFLERGYLLYVHDIGEDQVDIHLLEPPQNEIRIDLNETE